MLPGRQPIAVCYRLGRCRPPRLCPLIPHRRYDGPRLSPRKPASSTKIHQPLIPDSDDFWRNGMRKFEFAFDPAAFGVESRHLTSLAFLLPTEKHKYPEWKYANSLHPPTAGVPWPTSFSHTLQSKYWQCPEAELAGFVSQIVSKEFLEKEPWRATYVHELVDAAVAFVINVFPTSTPARLNILSKVYWVLFMHDDLVDLEGVSDSAGQEDGSPRSLSKAWLNRISSEVLSESPAQGRELLASMQEWASLDNVEPAIPQSHDEYLRRRIQNAGVYPVFRSVEFACQLRLSAAERESMEAFTAVCAEHFVFTNDLYSHAKEVSKADAEKAPFNVVIAVQNSSNATPEEAKAMVRQSLIEAENEIYREYSELRRAYGDNDVRLQYARGVVIALAGNMFYSATCGRYTKYADSDDGDFFDEW